MTYIRLFFVLYRFVFRFILVCPFFKFGPMPSQNPRCAPGMNLVVKHIQEKIFRRGDFIFELLINELKKYMLYKFHSQCLRDRRENLNITTHRSYIFNYLLDHICEMYDYGLIERKSYLPTNFKH